MKRQALSRRAPSTLERVVALERTVTELREEMDAVKADVALLRRTTNAHALVRDAVVAWDETVQGTMTVRSVYHAVSVSCDLSLSELRDIIRCYAAPRGDTSPRSHHHPHEQPLQEGDPEELIGGEAGAVLEEADRALVPVDDALPAQVD